MSAPTVRKRRLGSELRLLRESAGLKQEHVAARLSALTTSKISRIEKALIGVKPADLDGLLDLYGVSDEVKRRAMHSLAKDGSKKGWWQTYRDAISPEYADLLSLEADAKSMRSFQTSLIPGLLQTSAYARATIDAINMTSSAAKVNALVEVRMARQSVLTRPEPLALWAIIPEAALHTTISTPRAMKDQLQKLLDLSELPHVSIQVLPLSTEPHPGMVGSFSVIGFPETADLDVVLVEGLTSSLYVEDPVEVQRYGAAFERLQAGALPFSESADLIANLKDPT
ncbi:helix-turn-helix domain-containing protein [Streptomyces sp. NPDC058280]|uniref:helix-turn-helix domain-containing protein n=1 Tax=Streptomyces sp. NPDC058280 TaxID=3346419 RepID=UPI0036E706B6